jgi:hypothetical protein
MPNTEVNLTQRAMADWHRLCGFLFPSEDERRRAWHKRMAAGVPAYVLRCAVLAAIARVLIVKVNSLLFHDYTTVTRAMAGTVFFAVAGAIVGRIAWDNNVARYGSPE